LRWLNILIVTQWNSCHSCNDANYDEGCVWSFFLSTKAIHKFCWVHAHSTFVICLAGHTIFDQTTTYACLAIIVPKVSLFAGSMCVFTKAINELNWAWTLSAFIIIIAIHTVLDNITTYACLTTMIDERSGFTAGTMWAWLAEDAISWANWA